MQCPDCLEQQFAMSQSAHAKLLKVLVGKLAQNRQVDLIALKGVRVLTQILLVEPFCNVVLHGPLGIVEDEHRATAVVTLIIALTKG